MKKLLEKIWIQLVKNNEDAERRHVEMMSRLASLYPVFIPQQQQPSYPPAWWGIVPPPEDTPHRPWCGSDTAGDDNTLVL